MTVYRGPPLSRSPISLVEPEPRQFLTALATADLADSQKDWFHRAQSDNGCFFFAVQHQGSVAGQIVLHDIDWEAKEAMVAYHLFRTENRGRGLGTAALKALCGYAFGRLGLRRLVAITSYDNVASRRIAAQAGFRELGAAREGANLVVYEQLARGGSPSGCSGRANVASLV